jgi:ribosomal protein L29
MVYGCGMTKVITKPPANDLYDADFYTWTQEQARLLRERRWADLDLENLIDEVASVGSSEKREIRNRLVGLLAHLLKWKYQPAHRGASRRSTIREQRQQLAEIVEASRSLAGYLKQQAVERYVGATLRAAEETGIAIGVFPKDCPFTAEQVLDPDFFPEDRTME